MIDINDFEYFTDYCIAKEQESKEERLIYFDDKKRYENYLDSIPYAAPGSGILFLISDISCSGTYYK